MKILLDTCVYGGVRNVLQDMGHDVIWSGDWSEDPGDEEILATANSEGRILITLDKDFGELAIVFKKAHCGIVRLVNLSSQQQATVCIQVLNQDRECRRYTLHLLRCKADAKSTVAAFGGRVNQIVVCSSSAVYQRPFRSIPLVESEEGLTDDPTFAYAYDKAQMERYFNAVFQSQHIPITIIRPSLTFGHGAANMGILRQNFGIVDRIRKGKLLVMFGDRILALLIASEKENFW